MSRRARLWLVLACTLGCLILYGFWSRSSMQSEAPNGLFSWESDVLCTEQRRTLWDCMAQYHLTELYQTISLDTAPTLVSDFLQEAQQNGICVYLLVGDPSWALDSQAAALTKALTQAAAWRQLSGSSALMGIMADVEPYVTDAWNDDAETVMHSYLAGLHAAYETAKSLDLRLYTCISCYYDTWGFSEELTELITESCHGVAVMNYYRGNEVDNLRTEWKLATQAGKPLYSVYELQPAGNQGITSQNTYYEAGMSALLENWANLTRALHGKEPFGFALHDYRALLTLQTKEATQS